MRTRIQGKLQQFAGAMMVPIILLVAVGLFVGVGAAFTNYILQEGTIPWRIADVFVQIGFMIMNTLPMWFAVGIAFTLAKKEKGWAALNGLVVFFSLHTVISAWAASQGITAETTEVDYLVSTGMSPTQALEYNALWTQLLGIFTVNAGLFTGLIAGLAAAFVHNRLIGVKVPTMLSFFAGPRLGILGSMVAAVVLGIAFFYIWPGVAAGLQGITRFITASGLFGTFAFGTLDKMLLPLGLHHLIAFPIEYTQVGGTMEIDGQTFEGVRNIMAGQSASADATGYITRNFTTGRLLFMFGGIPGMALAMYRTAFPKNRKKVAALLIPAVLTAVVVGVTEPFEFTFVFIAPLVYYLVYAPLAGLAYVLMEVLNVSILGQGGLFMIPNLLQPQKVHAWPLLILIPVYFALYYFIFKFLITKFNLKTPGRGEDEEEIGFATKEQVRAKYGSEAPTSRAPGTAEVSEPPPGESSADPSVEPEVASPDTSAGVATNVAVQEKEKLEDRIVEALGGPTNIEEVSCCASRLRVTVTDPSKVVDERTWKTQYEALGLVSQGNYLQVIYGPRVIQLTSNIKSLLGID